MADPWQCVVVCSDGHDKRRIEVLVAHRGKVSPGRHSGTMSLEQSRRYRQRLDEREWSSTESTPTGGSKVRWVCPACGHDLALGWERLDSIGQGLHNAGVSEVELSSLIAIVSK